MYSRTFFGSQPSEGQSGPARADTLAVDPAPLRLLRHRDEITPEEAERAAALRGPVDRDTAEAHALCNSLWNPALACRLVGLVAVLDGGSIDPAMGRAVGHVHQGALADPQLP
eukprot:CAMPEP_0197884134 /NCGR_PEP_ID=MMETSP1439-20131203/10711_1 /TAXON_ID=66791 /ORGANISM="Gonyaulax spinifera, Strain CCMP409" /LENGTH=112 /DNA_ID=CAMNT_0043503865 /DNA_START=244 /DNA_END=581 /DNA_ORIENTATION=+